MNINLLILVALLTSLCLFIKCSNKTEHFITNTDPQDTTDFIDNDVSYNDDSAEKLLKSIDKLNKEIMNKESKLSVRDHQIKDQTNNKSCNKSVNRSNSKIKTSQLKKTGKNNIPIVSRPKLSNIINNNIDLSKYILKSKIPPAPDMDKYVLKSAVPKCKPMTDMSKYILKTEIPNCPKPPDKDKYILKSAMVSPSINANLIKTNTSEKNTKNTKNTISKKTVKLPKKISKTVTNSVERKTDELCKAGISQSKSKTLDKATSKLVRDTTEKLVKNEVARLLNNYQKKYVVNHKSDIAKKPVIPSKVNTYIPGVKALRRNTEPKKCEIYQKVIRNADVYGAY